MRAQGEGVLLLAGDAELAGPIAAYALGSASISAGSATILLPPMGTVDIDSTPPAMMTSALPERITSAAQAMAWEPEEQKRLEVHAVTSTGKPASREIRRAMFMPCSASGMAQPSMMSSTIADSSPGVRATSALSNGAANSSDRVSFRLPFLALPIGVRAYETITAFGMRRLSLLGLSSRATVRPG